jgi:MoaA/NifB/PqqE/SkfB family radical SAM enzyme
MSDELRRSFGDLAFDDHPLLAIWEVTQACDLACVHCRACAKAERDPNELTTDEARKMLAQLADMHVPLVVFTGGDPAKRPDLPELVAEGTRLGLTMAVTPSGTPLLTRDGLLALRDAGLARLAVSLDGADAVSHDLFRGVVGSFDETMRILDEASELGIPVQINTSVGPHNIKSVRAMAELVKNIGAVLWGVFLVVPVGRASNSLLFGPRRVELLLEELADLAQEMPFDIKTTAAPHYRRVLMQRRQRNAIGLLEEIDGQGIVRGPRGITDGVGFLFVSHTGRVSREPAVQAAARRRFARRQVRRVSVPSRVRRLSRPRVRSDGRRHGRGSALRLRAEALRRMTRPRSLAPKEHGAYAQLGLPLATALIGGHPRVSAVALTGAAIAVFLTHEPLLVVLGRRGRRAQTIDGRRAVRWLIASTASAALLGVPSLPLSWTLAIPLLLGVVVAGLVAYDRERTTLGEIVAAWCMSSVSIPVAVASGWSVRDAVSAAIAWMIGLSAATVAVRGILAVRKRGVAPSRTAALVGMFPAAAALAALRGVLPVWTVVASVPLVIVAIVVALRPPHPRSLHALGWTLVGATVMTAATIVVGVR